MRNIKLLVNRKTHYFSACLKEFRNFLLLLFLAIQKNTSFAKNPILKQFLKKVNIRFEIYLKGLTGYVR